MSNNPSQLVQAIKEAGHVLVVFPETESVDITAAAQALALICHGMGKEVVLASPRLPRFQALPGFELVVTEVGNQNLVISFDYTPEQVDKVSYHIGEETGRFYLTIKPQKGARPLDASAVSYDYIGVETDLVVTLGINDLEEIEQLYFGYEELYASKPVWSIASFEPSFATAHLRTSTGGHAQVIGSLLDHLDISPDPDVATTLFAGVSAATQQFSDTTVGADSFALAAELLKAGARRIKLVSETIEPASKSVSNQNLAPKKKTKKSAELPVKQSPSSLPQSRKLL